MGKTTLTRVSTGLVAAASVALLATSAIAANKNDVERTTVGTLKCDVSGGIGLILGSKKKMSCVFEHSDGTKDKYTGHIVKVGLDIGITKELVVWWEVLAPSSDVKAGALAGDYVGLSAEATVGVGVGANLLIGGGDHSFALQPLSVQTQKGANIAGGIGEITLKAAE